MMSTLGENIKASRENQHLSREELARKMRMGPRKIEEYESGEKIPSNETLMRLSTVLDIPASVLIGANNQKMEQEN
jgi:transcriptional regulator with XRE-family HTH domain